MRSRSSIPRSPATLQDQLATYQTALEPRRLAVEFPHLRPKQFPAGIFFAFDGFVMTHALVCNRLVGFDKTLTLGKIPQPARTIVTIMHQEKVRHALLGFCHDAKFIVREAFQNMAQAAKQRSGIQRDLPMSG